MTDFFSCVASNVVLAGGLAIVAVAVTRVWRNPHLAHALWLLVLIKLITPPIVRLPIDRFMVAHRKVASVTESPSTGSLLPNGPLLRTVRSVHSLLPDSDIARDSRGESRVWHSFLDAWPVWLLAAWSTGTVVLIGVGLLRHLRLLGSVADRHVPDVALTQDAKQLARQIGLPECPPLRVTSAHICPFVLPGLRAPAVILPQRLLVQLHRDQVKSMLAHELAHIRRRDHWMRVFQVSVLSLNWWNPVAWWASRSLQQAEEECCDAWVVWVLPENRRTYGETLLHTVEFLAEQNVLAAPVVASFFGCHLERRIELVMNQVVARRMPRAALALAFAIGAAILPLKIAVGQSAGPAIPPVGGNGRMNTLENNGVRANLELPETALSQENDFRESQVAQDPILPPDARILRDQAGHIIRVALSGKSESNRAKIRVETIEQIARIPSLKELNLSFSDVTDEVLMPIRKLRSLQSLNLMFSDATGRSIRTVSTLPNLTYLRLTACKVTDQDLDALSEMPQLAGLFLGRTQVTDAGMPQIGKLTQLIDLELSSCAITDNGLRSLGHMEHIQILDLSLTVRYELDGKSQFTDASVEYLSTLQTLIVLRIGDSQLTKDGISRLRDALPKCEVITNSFASTFLTGNRQ